MTDSLRPHGLQPTRLLHPWAFPGKSTGVSWHFLLLKYYQEVVFKKNMKSTVSFMISHTQSLFSSVQLLSPAWFFATPWPPCPSLTPGVHPNPCPSSRWCHPTISSSVIPFSCPQSFPASGSFQMSQLFTSGDQSIRASTSTSVLPMKTPRIDLLYDILVGSPWSPRDSQESSPTPQFKASIL